MSARATLPAVVFVAMVFAVWLPACEKIQNAIQTPGIAKVAPEPMTPVPLPTQTMKGGRGDADAAYPPDYGATVKPDGTILFPQHTTGRIQGSSIMVGNEAVLTVSPDGTLKGVALKHHYAFADDGALLDEDGHGVRILPERRSGSVGKAPAKCRTLYARNSASSRASLSASPGRGRSAARGRRGGPGAYASGRKPRITASAARRAIRVERRARNRTTACSTRSGARA